MKFNINNYVLVKLTPLGVSWINKYYADLGCQKAPELQYQTDGRVQFQLWELMSIFGTILDNGCDMPFETEIELDV